MSTWVALLIAFGCGVGVGFCTAMGLLRPKLRVVR
jgi:hypothetical protein